MVDVTPKEPTHRRALARCRVTMLPETTAKVANNAITKGDVLAAARIAGIQAAKRTADLIPMCHPVLVGSVGINFSIGDDHVEVESQVETVDRTGVEMEAMTACAVAALTIYDMCKSADRSHDRRAGRPVGEVRRSLRTLAAARRPARRSRRQLTRRRPPPVARARPARTAPAGTDGTVAVAVAEFGGRHAVVATASAGGPRGGALAPRDGQSLTAAARSGTPAPACRWCCHLASSGADVSEGVDALHGWGQAAAAVAACSGVVPVIAVVDRPGGLGAGAAAGPGRPGGHDPRRAWPSCPARRWWPRSPGSRSGLAELGGVAGPRPGERAVRPGVRRPPTRRWPSCSAILPAHADDPAPAGGQRRPAGPGRARAAPAWCPTGPAPPTTCARWCGRWPTTGTSSSCGAAGPPSW